MSKKDYQAIARAIYETHVNYAGVVDGKTLGLVSEEIADVMMDDNPRFDRARFIEACETGTTKGMPKQ